MAVKDLKLAQPITLPCGLTLPNRLVKAAMTEQLADKDHLPCPDFNNIYATWAEGEWGMVLTGNVQVNTRYLGGPADTAVNPAVPEAQLLETWKTWAAACNKHNTPTVMQINHPGRQSPYGAGTRGLFEKNVAPSAVPLRLGDGLFQKFASAVVFGTPREMTVAEIREAVAQFAHTARLAAEAGFAGVQVHAAHGYLLAQFLSSESNRRTDDYGGSPAKEARIVVEIIKAIREATPEGFCVGIKLNSVDHQSKEALADCMVQLDEVRKAGVDFLEISGGTYENPSVSFTPLSNIRDQVR
jgi:2,4-dienoyl-CoA reductase-like NADH-dependent reductase (Old Yellow Enzyme family)